MSADRERGLHRGGAMSETLTCVICGRTETADLGELDRKGWTWWTGWLPNRQAACPCCRKAESVQVETLIAYSRSDDAKAYAQARAGGPS